MSIQEVYRHFDAKLEPPRRFYCPDSFLIFVRGIPLQITSAEKESVRAPILDRKRGEAQRDPPAPLLCRLRPRRAGLDGSPDASVKTHPGRSFPARPQTQRKHHLPPSVPQRSLQWSSALRRTPEPFARAPPQGKKNMFLRGSRLLEGCTLVPCSRKLWTEFVGVLRNTVIYVRCQGPGREC